MICVGDLGEVVSFLCFYMGGVEPYSSRGKERCDGFCIHRQSLFRRLCVGTFFDAFGTWMERLVVGWFVLDMTGSVFLGALSFAARSAPNMLLGLFGGAVADRFPRVQVLIMTTSIKAALMCVLSAFGFFGFTSVWPVLALVAFGSVARASELPTIVGLIGDIVGPLRAASAISLHASGVRMIMLLASVAGGVLLQALGPGPVFLIAAFASALGALVYSTLRVTPMLTRHIVIRRSLWGDAVEGLRVALSIPVVLTLLLLALAVEVFAFSYQSLIPGLADRVLLVDASGLGLLTFGANLGGVLGVLSLTLLVDVAPRGVLLAAVTTVFALSLFALAASDRFLLSFGLMVVIGSMAGMFDALQWALLQASVPEEVRGRVMGLWVTAIGFGWLGPVVLGGTAEVFGTQWAIAVGGAVALLVAVAAMASPRLRQL